MLEVVVVFVFVLLALQCLFRSRRWCCKLLHTHFRINNIFILLHKDWFGVLFQICGINFGVVLLIHARNHMRGFDRVGTEYFAVWSPDEWSRKVSAAVGRVPNT